MNCKINYYCVIFQTFFWDAGMGIETEFCRQSSNKTPTNLTENFKVYLKFKKKFREILEQFWKKFKEIEGKFKNNNKNFGEILGTISYAFWKKIYKNRKTLEKL